MTDPSLTERLHAVLSSRNLRDIAAVTGVHHETVRRYLLGHSPSAGFLAAVCRSYRINGHWLLTGDGQISLDDMPRQNLTKLPPSRLLEALLTSLNQTTPSEPNHTPQPADGTPPNAPSDQRQPACES